LLLLGAVKERFSWIRLFRSTPIAMKTLWMRRRRAMRASIELASIRGYRIGGKNAKATKENLTNNKIIRVFINSDVFLSVVLFD
jgi:hypothetical protein